MLFERSNLAGVLSGTEVVPCCKKLVLMQSSPFENEAAAAIRERTLENPNRRNIEDGFVVAIERVKMGGRMFTRIENKLMP